eukprot:COSAG02_NODE_3185_length_7214_cov_31.354181_5_plen_79_part_00
MRIALLQKMSQFTYFKSGHMRIHVLHTAMVRLDLDGIIDALARSLHAGVAGPGAGCVLRRGTWGAGNRIVPVARAEWL